MILARYGELVLKGRNRLYFERRLVRNVRQACKPIAPVRVERQHGQLVLFPAGETARVARRLTEVFGLSAISPAWEADRDPDAIATMGSQLVGEALLDFPSAGAIPFRVTTKRADKRFPMTSVALDQYVAERVFEEHGTRLRANLSAPELTLGISVRRDRVYLFAQRLAGAGGLPSGTTGKVMALLSGGIDSPVATWMAMRRGLSVRLVTFESPEFLGRSPEEKVRRIASQLARWQPFTFHHRVPFSAVQLAVRDEVPERFRTVVYRRMMHRIASRIAASQGAGGLVTGDSLGQVASQTLENLAAIGAATTSMVLQPLIAIDKQETIERARRIGTYELSIEPTPDCCSVFQPDSPALRATPELALRAEAQLDLEGLVRGALEGAVEERIEPAP